MTQSAAEARRRYQRAWRKANPDKIKRHQETYWERKAAQADLQGAKEGESGSRKGGETD